MTGFSYQLYSSRDWPMDETITMLGRLGYAQVEGYGGLFADLRQADAFKALLDANGLRMTTGHFDFDMVAGDAARVLEIARNFDMQGVFVPAPPSAALREGKGDWATFAAALAEAGKPYLDAGLRFGYHNHHWEWAPQNGVTPIEMLLAGEGVSLEMDVAWVVRAGQDPLAWIERLGPKIVAAHLKDIAPAGERADEDGWADLGTGTMDWPAIMAALRAQRSARTFVIEHDKPSDHVRFATRSIENARKL